MSATPSQPDSPPQLAILFWFYGHLAVCASRLDELRRLNPGVSIYGLYGGPVKEADRVRERLGTRLDHFHAFPEERRSRWKWEHGDLLIVEWFRSCGHALAWDTLIVVQWDMLVVRPVREVFSGLLRDEIYISSVRPVRDIEAWWYWVNPVDPVVRPRYRECLDAAAAAFGRRVEPMASIFLVACLPRLFLERYAPIAPEAGFIEYRVPTYARALGVPFCNRLPFDAWVPEEPDSFTGRRKYLIPIKQPIPLPAVYLSQLLPAAPSILHPYTRVYRQGVLGALRSIGTLARDLPAFVTFWRTATVSWWRQRQRR